MINKTIISLRDALKLSDLIIMNEPGNQKLNFTIAIAEKTKMLKKRKMCSYLFDISRGSEFSLNETGRFDKIDILIAKFFII